MLQTDQNEDPRRHSNRHAYAPDDVPQYLIETAKTLIDTAVIDRQKHTDGVGQAIDLDALGVHFTPLDIVGICGCEAWLIILTDDEKRMVLASTCVFGEGKNGDGSTDVFD